MAEEVMPGPFQRPPFLPERSWLKRVARLADLSAGSAVRKRAALFLRSSWPDQAPGVPAMVELAAIQLTVPAEALKAPPEMLRLPRRLKVALARVTVPAGLMMEMLVPEVKVAPEEMVRLPGLRAVPICKVVPSAWEIEEP